MYTIIPKLILCVLVNIAASEEFEKKIKETVGNCTVYQQNQSTNCGSLMGMPETMLKNKFINGAQILTMGRMLNKLSRVWTRFIQVLTMKHLK